MLRGDLPGLLRLLMVVFAALTFMVGLLDVFVGEPQLHQDPQWISPDGWLWYAQHIFTQGMIDGQGKPTAFRGPALPTLLGAIIAVFGDSLTVLFTAQCVFHALANACIGLLAWLITGKSLVALLSMLMYMFYVPAWLWLHRIGSEPSYTLFLALFLLGFSLLLERPTLMRSLTSGVLFAITAMIRPATYGFMPILLICIWARCRSTNGMVRILVPLLIGFSLLEGPWIVRNYIVFRRFIPTTTGGWQLFFEATWYQAEGRMGNRLHDPEVFPLVKEGFWKKHELERQQIFKELAFKNIREHRFKLLTLLPWRFLAFWFYLKPSPHDPRSHSWVPTTKSLIGGGILYALALLGFCGFTASERKRYLPCLAFAVYLCGIHTFLHAEFRYSHPIQPYLMIPAAAALCAMVRRIELAISPKPANEPMPFRLERTKTSEGCE